MKGDLREGAKNTLNMFTTHNKYEVLIDNDGILMQVVQSRKF